MCFINETLFAWDCCCMSKVSVICTLIHVICSFAHPVFLSSFIHFMCHFNVAFKLFYTFLFEPLLIFICTSPVLLKNKIGWLCLHLTTFVYSGEKQYAPVPLWLCIIGLKLCPNQTWQDRTSNKSFLFYTETDSQWSRDQLKSTPNPSDTRLGDQQRPANNPRLL